MKRTIAMFLLFLRPAALDFASMGAGLTGGLFGMANAGNLPQYQGFVPGNARGNDQIWNTAMEVIRADTMRNAGMVDPQLIQSFSQMLGIDPSALVQASQAAGQQYGQLSGTATGLGAASMGMGLNQFGAGQDVYNLGRDPQNQLHDYLKNQVSQDVRAADSARGIGMGGVSAGNEMDAQRKFEMDWQNQQLARATQGLTGMNQAGYYGSQNLGRGLSMAEQAPGYTMQSAQLPFQTQMGAASLPMDIANMYSQAEQQSVMQPQMQVQNQINPYLGLSAQAGDWASQYGLNAANLHNQMQQQSQYGLWGGGQSQTPFMGGNQSGAGNPMNWMWGSGGGGAGGFQGVGGNPY